MCPIDRYRLLMYKYVSTLSSVCGVNCMHENYRINIFTVILQVIVSGYGATIIYTILTFDKDTKVKNIVIIGMLCQVSIVNFLKTFFSTKISLL